MAIAEVTVIPIGTGSTSVSSYVADIQKLLQQEQAKGGITVQMTAMSTIIEAGSLERLWQVIGLIHELPFTRGAERVSTSVKIDDRRDVAGSIRQKMQSVADKMQQL